MLKPVLALRIEVWFQTNFLNLVLTKDKVTQYLRWCRHDIVIARVHSVYLTNVKQRQPAADPQTMPNDYDLQQPADKKATVLVIRKGR